MKRKNLVLLLMVIFLNFIVATPILAKTYNNYTSNVISCGGKMVEGIPVALPKIISIVYTIIQIAIPILLVIFGSLDLLKGITTQKDEEIRKGQQMFIKRIITGVLVFFVFVVVKVVISLVADNTGNGLIKCTECFIKNNNECKK